MTDREGGPRPSEALEEMSGLNAAFRNWSADDFAYFEKLCGEEAIRTEDMDWQYYALSFRQAKEWAADQAL